MTNEDKDGIWPDALESQATAMEELKVFIDLGLKIIFEAPKPMFRFPAYRCSDWFNQSNPACIFGPEISRTELLEYRKSVLEILISLVKKIPETYLWDPFQVICPASPTDRCYLFRDNRPLFFDGDHLSGFGNLVVYDSFSQFLNDVEKAH